MIVRKVSQPLVRTGEPSRRGKSRWARGPRHLGHGLSRGLRRGLIRLGLPRRLARRVVGGMFRLLLVALAVAALVGGRAAFAEWRARRFFQTASAAAQRGDLPESAFALYLLLGSRPDDLPAHRLMAEVAERAKSPQAIYHRRRVVELAP